MQDYPAAHSMDTNWFAVDADGNIGYFDSGEGGAVPTSYQSSEIEYYSDIFLAIAENHPDRIVQLKASGNVIAKSLTMVKLQENIGYAHKYSEAKSSTYDLLLLLSNRDAISLLAREALMEDAYILSFAGDPIVVFLNYCYISPLQKLIASKQILGGRELDNNDYFLSLLGFFSYSVPEQYPYPYQRLGKPASPIMLEDLPEFLKDKIHWNRLDMLRFSEQRKIQPIEHMSCYTWGDDKGWIDTEGNEREGHPYDSD
jgi:hypothetical protein